MQVAHSTACISPRNKDFIPRPADTKAYQCAGQ